MLSYGREWRAGVKADRQLLLGVQFLPYLVLLPVLPRFIVHSSKESFKPDEIHLDLGPSLFIDSGD